MLSDIGGLTHYHAPQRLTDKQWTPTNIVQVYGAGIYWYLFFIQFLQVSNLGNIGIEAITLVPHLDYYFSHTIILNNNNNNNNTNNNITSLLTGNHTSSAFGNLSNTTSIPDASYPNPGNDNSGNNNNNNNNHNDLSAQISDQVTSWVQIFMLTSYQPSEYLYWYISVWINAGFCLLQGVLYLQAVRWQRSRYALEDPRDGSYDTVHHNQIAINALQEEEKVMATFKLDEYHKKASSLPDVANNTMQYSNANNINQQQQQGGIPYGTGTSTTITTSTIATTSNNTTVKPGNGTTQYLYDTTKLNRFLASKYERCRRGTRLLVSLVLFATLLVAYGFSLYYTQVGLSRVLSVNGVSWFMAGIQIFTDVFWTVLCNQLTELEGHATSSPMYKWLCVRLFVFKMLSYFLFYYVRDVRLQIELNATGECVLSALGAQRLIMAISYLCSDLVVDILIPVVYNAYNRRKAMRSRKANNFSLFEFNIAEHLCARLYRQFLLSEGNTYIPGLSVFALIGHTAQYYVDRWKLRSSAHVPKPVADVFTPLIVAVFLVIFFANLFGYPKGLVWFWWNKTTFLHCDSAH
jgi:hypothetical protein